MGYLLTGVQNGVFIQVIAANDIEMFWETLNLVKKGVQGIGCLKLVD